MTVTYRIDVPSPNKVREWSELPRVFDHVDDLMCVAELLLDTCPVLRIRKIEVETDR